MPPDIAPKLKRTEACRGVAALMDALDQIGLPDGKDSDVAKRIVDAELDLRELITYALAMLALNR